MTNEKKQEFTRRISSANPTDMVVVIYDIALEYIEEAKEMAAGLSIASEVSEETVPGEDIRKKRSALNLLVVKIRNCINELIGSLHYDYSPAGEMLWLYMYCSIRLMDAQKNGDASAFTETGSILKRLRDAYAQIAPTNKAGAVMNNSESVYAGLTYGRGTLNEDVLGSSNRGFLA